MDNYITLIGNEHSTAINSLWAVLKQQRFVPDELLLVIEKEEVLIDGLKKDFKRLLENYDIDTSIESIVFSDLQDVRRTIESSKTDESGEIALDISSASKLTTAKVLIDKNSDMLDHVFYLEVKDEEGSNPLPTIEPDKVRLRDLKDGREEEI